MSSLLVLIYLTALNYGVDPHLAISTAFKESSLRTDVQGQVGEIGLFQIRPEYVRETREELFDAETNTRVAMRLLLEARKSCREMEGLKWLNCYNRGVYGAKKLKHLNTEYVIKVSKIHKCLKKYNYLDFLSGKGKECRI